MHYYGAQADIAGPQSLEQLVTALSSAGSSDSDSMFSVAAVLPSPFQSLTLAPSDTDDDAVAAAAGEEPLTLPLVLVPPESDENDLTIGAATGIEHAIPLPPISAGLRGDEGVGYEGTRLHLRLFDDAVRSAHCSAIRRLLTPLS